MVTNWSKAEVLRVSYPFTVADAYSKDDTNFPAAKYGLSKLNNMVAGEWLAMVSVHSIEDCDISTRAAKTSTCK